MDLFAKLNEAGRDADLQTGHAPVATPEKTAAEESKGKSKAAEKEDEKENMDELLEEFRRWKKQEARNKLLEERAVQRKPVEEINKEPLIVEVDPNSGRGVVEGLEGETFEDSDGDIASGFLVEDLGTGILLEHPGQPRHHQQHRDQSERAPDSAVNEPSKADTAEGGPTQKLMQDKLRQKFAEDRARRKAAAAASAKKFADGDVLRERRAEEGQHRSTTVNLTGEDQQMPHHTLVENRQHLSVVEGEEVGVQEPHESRVHLQRETNQAQGPNKEDGQERDREMLRRKLLEDRARRQAAKGRQKQVEEGALEEDQKMRHLIPEEREENGTSEPHESHAPVQHVSATPTPDDENDKSREQLRRRLLEDRAKRKAALEKQKSIVEEQDKASQEWQASVHMNSEEEQQMSPQKLEENCQERAHLNSVEEERIGARETDESHAPLQNDTNPGHNANKEEEGQAQDQLRKKFLQERARRRAAAGRMKTPAEEEQARAVQQLAEEVEEQQEKLRDMNQGLQENDINPNPRPDGLGEAGDALRRRLMEHRAKRKLQEGDKDKDNLPKIEKEEVNKIEHALEQSAPHSSPSKTSAQEELMLDELYHNKQAALLQRRDNILAGAVEEIVDQLPLSEQDDEYRNEMAFFRVDWKQKVSQWKANVIDVYKQKEEALVQEAKDRMANQDRLIANNRGYMDT